MAASNQIIGNMPIRLTQEDTIYSVERCPIFPLLRRWSWLTAKGATRLPRLFYRRSRPHAARGSQGLRERATGCTPQQSPASRPGRVPQTHSRR